MHVPLNVHVPLRITEPHAYIVYVHIEHTVDYVRIEQQYQVYIHESNGAQLQQLANRNSPFLAITTLLQ